MSARIVWLLARVVLRLARLNAVDINPRYAKDCAEIEAYVKGENERHT